MTKLGAVPELVTDSYQSDLSPRKIKRLKKTFYKKLYANYLKATSIHVFLSSEISFSLYNIL